MITEAYKERIEIAKEIGRVLEKCTDSKCKFGTVCQHTEELRQLGELYNAKTVQIRTEKAAVRSSRGELIRRRRAITTIDELAEILELPSWVLASFENTSLPVSSALAMKIERAISALERDESSVAAQGQ